MPQLKARPDPLNNLLWFCSSRTTPGKEYVVDLVNLTCDCLSHTCNIMPERRRQIALGGDGMLMCVHTRHCFFKLGWLLAMQMRVKALEEQEAAQLQP